MQFLSDRSSCYFVFRDDFKRGGRCTYFLMGLDMSIFDPIFIWKTKPNHRHFGNGFNIIWTAA
jgi:hypothetical protein